jgi:hypothetical protein
MSAFCAKSCAGSDRYLETAALVLAGLVLLSMGLIIVASILGKVLFLRPDPGRSADGRAA